MPRTNWKPFRKRVPRDLHYESFEAFFEVEFKRSVRLLMYGGATLDEAEDAVNDAMTSTWLDWEKIRNPTSWVHVVAKRKLVKVRERQRHERRYAEKNPPARHHEDQYPSEDEYIRSTIARLPETQRTVIELHLAGFTIGEIAQLTSARPPTVRSNLRHARESLERELSQPAATPNAGGPHDRD